MPKPMPPRSPLPPAPGPQEPTRARGTILRLVFDRGFGFIRGTESGLDFFFHRTSLENCELEDLSPGTEVSFEPLTTVKGARAEHVTRLRE